MNRSRNIARRPDVGAMLLLVVLSTAACTPVAGADPPEQGDMQYATHDGQLGAGDGAALSGMLHLQEGCLVLETAEGTVVVPLLPLDETTWQYPALIVGGEQYWVGKAAIFGGGFAGPDLRSVDVPAVCADVGEFFVVTSTG